MQKIKTSTDDIVQNSDFQIRHNFKFSYSEHSTTSEENLQKLTNKRAEQLQGHTFDNDLTKEEITDIKEYRSGIEKTIRFQNVKELLKDLNE